MIKHSKYLKEIGVDPMEGVDARILYGAYKGVYHVSNEAICQSPVEPMATKQGKQIAMRAVPLDKMERVE